MLAVMQALGIDMTPRPHLSPLSLFLKSEETADQAVFISSACDFDPLFAFFRRRFFQLEHQHRAPGYLILIAKRKGFTRVELRLIGVQLQSPLLTQWHLAAG